MSDFYTNLYSGQERENNVLEYLLSNGLSCDIYKNKTGKFDFLGEPKTNQDIRINGKIYKCPDIRVFDRKKENRIIYRVKVKSLYGKDKFSHLFNKIPVVGISIKAFENYVLFQNVDEVDCSVVFVIGEGEWEYEYFWETLPNLQKIKHKVGNLYGEKDGYFWRIQDLNEGLESLVNDIMWKV